MNDWLLAVRQAAFLEGWTIHLVGIVGLIYSVMFGGITLVCVRFYGRRRTMTKAEREAEDKELWNE